MNQHNMVANRCSDALQWQKKLQSSNSLIYHTPVEVLLQCISHNRNKSYSRPCLCMAAHLGKGFLTNFAQSAQSAAKSYQLTNSRIQAKSKAALNAISGIYGTWCRAPFRASSATDRLELSLSLFLSAPRNAPVYSALKRGDCRACDAREGGHPPYNSDCISS